LRERLRTESGLASGLVRCQGRIVADSETLGSLGPALVEKPSGKVFVLSLAIDGFVPCAEPVPQTPPARITVEVSSSAGDLVSSMDATSETTVVELNVRLQKDGHGFQKLLYNGRIVADFETLGSLCAESAGATASKLALQSENQEPFLFAFEGSESRRGNIQTTCNIRVDQITGEVLDRFATPDPAVFKTEAPHAWLLRILRGDEYGPVLDSNPEHAERLMALVSSTPAEVKVLRYSTGTRWPRGSTNEVLIAGHRLMLVSQARTVVDVAAQVPAPAMEEKEPGRVLTVDIQSHDETGVIHVSCLGLSGEEAMSAEFPADATVAHLEAAMKSTLKWFQLEFLNLTEGAAQAWRHRPAHVPPLWKRRYFCPTHRGVVQDEWRRGRPADFLVQGVRVRALDVLV